MAFAAGGNPFGTQGAVSAAGLPTSSSDGTPAQTVVAAAAAPQVGRVATPPATPGVTVPLTTNAAAGTVPGIRSIPFGGTTDLGNVGGELVATQGTIIATNNGGFSWVIQTVPSMNYTCSTTNVFGVVTVVATPPATLPTILTSAAWSALGSGGGFCSFAAYLGPGANTWNWQAYQPQATMKQNTIPAINGLGFTSSLGNHNGWAVGDSGYIIQTAFKQNILVNSITQPMTTWSLVTGSAIGTTDGTGSVYLSTGYLNLFGITWCASC